MIAKFVQIMMVCAIFNPFCCCTAGVLSADEVKSTPSCCQSSESEAPANKNEDHDPSECPHKALKEYQATALKDLSDSQHVSTPLPLLLTLIEWITFEPVAQTTQRVQLATVSQAPPPALAQMYCVYRI